MYFLNLKFAYSAGAVEYIDCFSALGKTPSTSALDMPISILMVSFQ